MGFAVLEQLKSGEVSLEIKNAAARGVLPVSREELIEILVFLCEDPDPSISQLARQSLAAFPEDVLKPLLESSFTSQAVFTLFGRPPLRSKSLVEAIILNRAAPDEVIASLAAHVDADLMEAVLINLMRLLRAPEILEALEGNPHNTPDTHRRIREIRFEFFEKRNTFVPISSFSPTELGAAGAAATSTDPGEGMEPHPHTTDESVESIVEKTSKLLHDDGEELPAERVTVLQKIARMTVAERVQLAILGAREERVILIRDSNKVVCRSVLQSPKLAENEVEWFSQMRNVNEEVLRLIGLSRKWAKNYVIHHNLVRNARTPVAISLPLVNRLLTRDLRALTMNKNVPEVVRRSAQRMMQTRLEGR